MPLNGTEEVGRSFFGSDLLSPRSCCYFAPEPETKTMGIEKRSAVQELRCSCGKKIAEIRGEQIVIGHRGCSRLTVVRYDEAAHRFVIERP